MFLTDALPRTIRRRLSTTSRTTTMSPSSTTPLRTPQVLRGVHFGYQAELLPSSGYDPNLYFEDNTSNIFVSSDTVRSSATSLEQNMSQRLSLQKARTRVPLLGASLCDTLHRNEGCKSEEIRHAFQRTCAREVGEFCVHQGFGVLHHQERHFEEAAASHRWQTKKLFQTETERVSI